jgi:hypothetical protein
VASAFGIAPDRADAVIGAVTAEFAWRVDTAALSRGGLADLVEMLGLVDGAAYLASDRLLLDEAAHRDGEAILTRLLGTRHASRTLAARAARRGGVDADMVASMLPRLAVAAIGASAMRRNAALAGILAQVPPLGRLSGGSRHADLADILRRRCGAGAYSPRALPRAVRRAVAPSGASRGRGIAVWYARFMVGRHIASLLRSLGLRWNGASVRVVR